VPIYEYHCRKCGETFEAFQKITDKPLTKCKFCQGAVEKLFSQTSFQLKGSGWYLTDYARKSKSSADAGSKTAEKSDGGDKGGKGDTKQETKKDTKTEAKSDK